MNCLIYSIGHSNHPWANFQTLLEASSITAIADVRSAPYSKWSPHYCKDELRSLLNSSGIRYSYLGDELGGRPKQRKFFHGSVADYEKMAQAPAFHLGIQRLILGSKKYRIAVLCSEHDPLDCHRCLLIGRDLKSRGLQMQHILADGSVEEQDQIEERLLKFAEQDDLFIARDVRLASAYRKRSLRVAFSESLTK